MSEKAITSAEPQILDKLSQVLRKLEDLEQKLRLVEADVNQIKLTPKAHSSGDQ
jgi:conjugal transfer/entry exclusion protein